MTTVITLAGGTFGAKCRIFVVLALTRSAADKMKSLETLWFQGFSLVREAGLELWASRIDQFYPVTESLCGSGFYSICSCYFLLNGTRLY